MKVNAVLVGMILSLFPFSFAFPTFEIGPVTFTLDMLGVLLGLPVILVYAFIKQNRVRFGILEFIILLVCFSYGASALLSERPIESGYLALHGIILPALSFFFIANGINTPNEYDVAFKLMITGIVAFSAFVTISFFLAGMTKRVDVFSRDSIAAATFALVPILFCLYGGVLKSKLWILPFLVCVTAFFAALSRGYLVFFSISPILYYAIRRGKAFTIIFLFIVSTLAGTLLLAYNPGYVEPSGRYEPRYENTLARVTEIDYWKSSLYGRLRAFRKSLNSFEDSPILGVGLKRQRTWGASTIHNFHIEWLSYGGIVGYILFFLIFVAHFYKAGPFAKYDRFCAINLMTILIILGNALMNGFLHGVMPYMTFIIFGFNEARVHFLHANNQQ